MDRRAGIGADRVRLWVLLRGWGLSGLERVGEEEQKAMCGLAVKWNRGFRGSFGNWLQFFNIYFNRQFSPN